MLDPPKPDQPPRHTTSSRPDPVSDPGYCPAMVGDDLDIFDPTLYGTVGVPHERYARLRREAPVHRQREKAVLGWPAGPGYWAVMGHEDCRTVLRQARLFSSHDGATQIRDPHPIDLAFVQRMMLNLDPPEHTRLRTLVGKGFTRTNVRRAGDPDPPAGRDAGRRRGRAGRSRLHHRRRRRPPADHAGRGAGGAGQRPGAAVRLGQPGDRLPGRGLRRLRPVLGRRRRRGCDADGAAAHRHRVAPGTPRPDGRTLRPPIPGRPVDMFAYAHALADWKRQHQGDDVMSVLLRAEHEGKGLTEEEFENLFFLFAVAGNETLRNGLPGGLYSLLRHPDQYRRLVADPGLLPTAVEEMLRYWTPVIHFRRTATEDTTLGGEPIRPGTRSSSTSPRPTGTRRSSVPTPTASTSAGSPTTT